MPSSIKLSRGNITKVPSGLAEGQLFWQARNLGVNPSLPFDEGTLFIGRPDLSATAQPIAMGGYRSMLGMVFRGYAQATANISDELFCHAQVGDFWIFSEKPAIGSYFSTNGDFRKDDIILITASTRDQLSGKVAVQNGVPQITFIKICASGGRALDTSFDNSGTNFTSNNVQDALKELELEKLSYRGTIASAGDPVVAAGGDRGTLYLVITDGITFASGPNSSVTTKKGDFVYWTDSAIKWKKIPSGYTDAADIDFNDAQAIAASLNGTFEAQHIVDAGNIKDVQSALAFLLRNKAMIGANGKVPLTQLPDTVLGAMQYKGIWNPLLADNPLGKTDVAYQNDWPTSPEDGDYYVVKIPSGTVNVQYYDKKSSLNNGTYSRVIELNNGDWVVWQHTPVEINNDDFPNGHWEKIDNSDRISVLNVYTNADIVSGEPALRTATRVELVGAPSIGADNKLCIYDNGGIMTIAGLRLIDQSKEAQGRSNYVPRYTKYTGIGTNTIENSNIEDSADNGVTIHHNLQIGTEADPHNEVIYGDITLLPKFEKVDGVPTRSRSKITFKVLAYDPATSPALPENYKQISLYAQTNTEDGAQLLLPEGSSTLVGKLKDIVFVSGRIVKSIRDGYVESTSIEEHMVADVDGNSIPNIVEIHAPTEMVNNLGIRHLTVGAKASVGGTFDADGTFPDAEKLAHIWSNVNQASSEIELYFPARSGTLISDTDWIQDIIGDVGTMPIYGGVRENKMQLVNSKIRQINSLLLTSLKQSKGYQAGTVDDPTQDDIFVEANVAPNADNNIELGTDVLIGAIDKMTGKVTKKNLHLTGLLALGNDETNVTFVKAGRTLFGSDSQYRDPFTDDPLPEETIFVEPPSFSGVLLTSNSPIDGGVFI